MQKQRFVRWAAAGFLVLSGWAIPLRSQVAVYTGQYDTNRTGANLAETVLTTSNVNSSHFGLLFSRQVDGPIYAQPLYVPNVTINGATQNVVYVATMNNSVYAFDADNPSATVPLWSVNLGPSVPAPGSRMPGEIGVLGTPVIDPSTGTLYAVTYTYPNQTRQYSLHALDITSGAEKFGAPVVITATVAGTAVDAVSGKLTLNPTNIRQRAALLLFGGVVHIAFGAGNESQVYHGWLLGYNASTLKQAYAVSSSPNGLGGGIWMSARGPAADSNGIYFAVGNGSVGAGGLGEGTIRLGNTTDYFITSEYKTLNQNDWDFGSGGPLLIPGTNLLVTGSKIGELFLLNRSNLGQLQTGDNGVVQGFQVSPPCSSTAYNGCFEIHHTTYWNRTTGTPFLYVWAWGDTLKAFAFSNGLFNTTPASQNTAAVGYPGGILALSANGNTAGSGILWATVPDQLWTGDGPAPAGSLHAFDASNVATELWNSDMNSADNLGILTKFALPVVSNGKVYVATSSNALRVYGLH